MATLLALAFAPEASRAEWPQIKERGSLRVLAVVGINRRTIAVRRPDSPGFDYEMLEGLATLHHLKLELVPIEGWDRVIPALQEGRGDVIAGSFTISEARQKLIDFTAEVMPTRCVVVTRKPRAVINSIEQLRAEKVTVFRGTNFVDLLLGLGVPASNIDQNPPAEGLSAGLQDGRIRCVVYDVQTAFVERQADPDLQIGMFLGPSRSYGWGVRKGEPQLLAALNEHLANVRRSGTWSRLAIKYFGVGATEILQQARAEQPTPHPE